MKNPTTMKTYLLSAFITVLLSTNCFGQFGVSAKYENNSNKGWINSSNEQILKNSLEFGVNYWFRLKNKRVEFLPEISYALASQEFGASSFVVDIASAERSAIYFNLNTQIYPLDFEGDCNCPTFSKDGNLIKKGFYWLISPGIGYHNVNTSFSIPAETIDVEETGQLKPRLGIGAGLDIGIKDFLTVSPFILYNKDFGVDMPGIEYTDDAPTMQADGISSDINTWQFGIRLMFRPDYVKSQGGFRRR